MLERYNDSIYLKPSDLNAIENTIENLTNEIQEKIFDNQSSPLRNIQVGDNLNGKTIYIQFPQNIYESISGSENIFIKTDNDCKFNAYVNETSSFNLYNVRIQVDNKYYIIYRKKSDTPATMTKPYSVKLPYTTGYVTEIDTNSELYQYIKIYDDEYIIPNYVKHIWSDNEFLSMQKIENIERGVDNIGKYYYKPTGWVNSRQWLVPLGINMKNISYQDLNRWVDNLNIINFDDLENMTIWNSDITQLQWNMNSDIEWEDL